MSKIELSKEYKTRDGREVKIFMVDGGGTHPVLGAITNGTKWTPFMWTNDGIMSYIGNPGDDLIEVKPVRKLDIWVNVYEFQPNNTAHPSKMQADYQDEGRVLPRVACVHIVKEYTEGEGVEE